jgi:hypothetical protein
MGSVPDWAIGPHDDVEPGVTVRLNGDGTIDEVVIDQPVRFHLEQMDDDRYWIGLSWTDADGVKRDQHVWFTRHKKSLYPTVVT